MKPIEFPQANMVWAKDQKPYLPLPAHQNEVETISKWKLTWWERIKVVFTGRLWLRQLNFGMPLQPQQPSVHTPFLKVGKA